MTDLMALAVCHALTVSTDLARAHVGQPVLVCDTFGQVQHWPAYLRDWPGQPVVEMVVQSDGVFLVSKRRGHPIALRTEFVRYPTFGGVPDPVALYGSWRESLDSVLALALATLPAPGQFASP